MDGNIVRSRNQSMAMRSCGRVHMAEVVANVMLAVLLARISHSVSVQSCWPNQSSDRWLALVSLWCFNAEIFLSGAVPGLVAIYRHAQSGVFDRFCNSTTFMTNFVRSSQRTVFDAEECNRCLSIERIADGDEDEFRMMPWFMARLCSVDDDCQNWAAWLSTVRAEWWLGQISIVLARHDHVILLKIFAQQKSHTNGKIVLCLLHNTTDYTFLLDLSLRLLSSEEIPHLKQF